MIAITKEERKESEGKAANWVDYKPKEVEDLIVKYAKQGTQSAQIGLILRDQYGIPSVKTVTKKTISQILKDNKLYTKLPEDLLNLMRRVVELRVHLERNKKDYQSYRGMELAESKLRALAKYYRKKGILPANWKYKVEEAKLLIR